MIYELSAICISSYPYQDECLLSFNSILLSIILFHYRIVSYTLLIHFYIALA